MASAAAQRRLAHLRAMGRTETVVYRPADGLARTVDALVTRESLGAGPRQQASQPAIHARTIPIMVTLLNDAALGVAADALDVGADRLDVAELPGRDATTRNIQRTVPLDDPDWIGLEVS